MAGDLLGAIDVLQTHPDLDSSRLGLFGFSQGGWVVPTAAALAPEEVAFMIIGSGPAVTLGEEELYSVLTGDNACAPSGLSEAEIKRRLDEAGPSGFDPVPYLERVATPGLWLYGGRDTSVPVSRSVATLERIRDGLQKDFTITVFPNANHELVDGGTMCESEGPRPGVMEAIFGWLLPHLGL
ncbi:MAG: prolyl oligopeptidase family serine peptidase [Gemmatimonadetes bacterium]|nr:prolyl oligopeptidase family serine peptidase [Gemmatimonadota bacterium]